MCLANISPPCTFPFPPYPVAPYKPVFYGSQTIRIILSWLHSCYLPQQSQAKIRHPVFRIDRGSPGVPDPASNTRRGLQQTFMEEENKLWQRRSAHSVLQRVLLVSSITSSPYAQHPPLTFSAHPSQRWVPAPAEAGECRHLPPKRPFQQLLASYVYKLSHCNMALAGVGQVTVGQVTLTAKISLPRGHEASSMLPKSLTYFPFIPKMMIRLMSSMVCKENDQTTASE